MGVLVTGGLGVNGAWVLRGLAEDGTEVVSFDYSTDTSLVGDLIGNVEMVKGDISDLDQIKRTIQKHSIDAVIHMAGLVSPEVTSVDPKVANPAKGFEVNGRGTWNVLEACRLCDVKKLVFTSSKGVYGAIAGEHGYPNYVPITEDYPTNPSTIYDCMKILGENLGVTYSNIYGIDFSALRFAHIYAPGKLDRHGPLSIHDRIISNALQGIPTKVESGGDTRDDLIYVKDVARAHLLSLKTKKAPHHRYHFGTGRATSLIEFGEIVRRLIPSAQIQIGHGLGYYGKTVPGTQCAIDYSRARADLGFTPEFELPEGIKHYIDWMKAHKATPNA